MEYLSLVRHRVWLVALMLLIGGAVAWFTTPSAAVETAKFRATTTLLAGGGTTTAGGGPNLVLVASLAHSSDVLNRAAEKADLSAADIADGLVVAVSSEAGTVTITSTSDNPDRAVLEARTVASELIVAFVERMQQQLTPLATNTSAHIAELQAQHAQLSGRILTASPQEAQLLTTQRDSVLRELGSAYDQLQQLTAQRAGVATQLVVFEPPVAIKDTDTASFGVPGTKAGRGAVGAVLGLAAGLAVAVGSERLNPKIRGRAQAELAFGLPVIAEIPRVRSRRRVTTFRDPYSLIAESYRSLRTALHHVPPRVPSVGMGNERNVLRLADPHPDGDGQYAPEVVLVTSAMPDEGKTTVVANLAAAFAEKDKDVAVVNADSRNATIESVLISGRAARIARAGQEASFTNIPGVRLFRNERGNTPAVVVNSERSLVRRARTQSDVVIVDTPPMLATSDAAELMQDVDATIVVARCGVTTLKSGRRTAELLARLGLRVVGVVLIGTDDAPFSSSRGYRSRPSRRERRQQKRLAQWQLEAASANIRGNGSTSGAAEPSKPERPPGRQDTA